MWVLIDRREYPHPFSLPRDGGCFAHLKRWTGDKPIFLMHSDWKPIKIIPHDALGPGHFKYIIDFLLFFLLNYLCMDLTHIRQA